VVFVLDWFVLLLKFTVPRFALLQAAAHHGLASNAHDQGKSTQVLVDKAVHKPWLLLAKQRGLWVHQIPVSPGWALPGAALCTC
jgi:hypothetical protein